MNGNGNTNIPPHDLDGYWIESLDINDIHLHRSIGLQSDAINQSLSLIQKAELFDQSQMLQEDLQKLIDTFEKHLIQTPPEKLPELKIPQVLLLKDVKGRFERLHTNLQLFEHHLKQRAEEEPENHYSKSVEEETNNIYRKRIQLMQTEAHERVDLMKYFAKDDYLKTRDIQEFIRETIKQSQSYKGVLMDMTQKYSSDVNEVGENITVNIPDESEVLKMIESLFQGEAAADLRRLHKDLKSSAVSQLLF